MNYDKSIVGREVMDDIFFVHSFQRLFSFVKIICMYLLVLDIYLNYTANENNEDLSLRNTTQITTEK